MAFYLKTLAQTIQLVQDLNVLRYIGFTTDFGSLRKGLAASLLSKLVGEDALAVKAFDFAVGIMRFRLGSMLWHNAMWLGLLALSASDEEVDNKLVLQRLREDFAVWQAAKEYASASPFIDKIVQRCPFSTRFMN